jgi:hypothetical protein
LRHTRGEKPGSLHCAPIRGGFPDGVKVDNSYVVLPELPGIGFEGKADLYAELKQLAS